VIETERLLLRKPLLEDARSALPLLTDPIAMEFLGGVHPNAASDPEFVVGRWLERWEGNDCGPFSIVRREDGRWLGRAGVLVWDIRTWTHTTFATAGEFAQPELGWALAREHWGHGYATEAAAAVREWAYHERGFERLISLIEAANVRSQRVAERLDATPGETIELFDNGPHVVWEHPRPVSGTATKP
jgi:RimJ/RimL family protein N-acetyltransferase